MSVPKQITFIDENEQVLIDAVNEFCGPVVSTLGPGGCTVIITNDESEVPHVTKDGVTVAESIFFKDQRKQAIASLIKEAARKTATSVGDGTTTSVVLAQTMILLGLEGLKKVTSKKDFFEGFDLAFEKIIDYLTESSISITKDSTLLESVVKISTNGDDKICKIIMSAVKQAGADGIVNVELGDQLRTTVDVKSGASLESRAFVLNSKPWEVSGEIDLILIAGALTKVHEIHNLVKLINSARRPAIIIAKEFSDEVITTFMVNNKALKTNVALVEAEGFARESRGEILDDIASIFDVPVYSLDGSTGVNLTEYVPSQCVFINKAIITPSETILFRTDDTLNSDAEMRYNALKKDYDEAKSGTEIVEAGVLRHLQRRMAKYNVVATIKVGASTLAEAKEMKDRIDDALCAITAAVNGGISQGGGMALYKAGITFTPESSHTDKDKGQYFLAKCCLVPFKVLAKNTGIAVKDLVCGNADVIDFKTGDIVNWLDGGIIDPTQVSIAALTNASSVAKTILKSNSIISEWQED